MNALKYFVLGLFLLIFCTGLSILSCKGTISGTVTDPAENPVEGATVTLSEGDYSSTTDAEGKYVLNAIPLGNYTVTASKQGYTDGSKEVSLEKSGIFDFKVEVTADIQLGNITQPLVPTKIISNASPTTIYADGTSTSLITATVCYNDNTTVTNATNSVIFTVSGQGTLLGSASKNAISGIATVTLQSTSTAGTITVTSTALGLSQSVVNVTTLLPSLKIINTANPYAISADGTSTSLITARICDSGNNTVTTATNEITFSIIPYHTGWNVGTLLGTNPKNATNGIVTIIFQTSTTPDFVTIKSVSVGITPGQVEVTTTVP